MQDQARMPDDKARPPSRPPRRRQEDRSAETQSRLIEAAIQLLHENGFAATSVDRIASSAGLTRGALSHHFQSKADLVVAVMHAVSDERHLRLAECYRELSRYHNRCERMVRALWQAIYGDPAYVATIEILLGSRSDPELRARVESERGRSADSIYSVWDEMLSDDQMPEQRRTDAMHLTIATLRGLAVLNLVARDPEFIERQLALLATAVETIMRP